VVEVVVVVDPGAQLGDADLRGFFGHAHIVVEEEPPACPFITSALLSK
jgi:hypothetical protein